MPEPFTPGVPKSITGDDFERFITSHPPEHWSNMTVGEANQTGGLYIPGLDITPANAEVLVELASRTPIDHRSGSPMPLSFNPETGVFQANMPEDSVTQDPGAEAARIIQDLTDACTAMARDNNVGTKRPISIVSIANAEGWHTDGSKITEISLSDVVLEKPSMRVLAALSVSAASFATRSNPESTTRLMDRDLAPEDAAFFEQNANTAELYKMICFNGLKDAHTGKVLDAAQSEQTTDTPDTPRVIFNYWNGRN